MWIFTWSSLPLRSSARSYSYALRRAFGVLRRAPAPRRPQLSSSSTVGPRAPPATRKGRHVGVGGRAAQRVHRDLQGGVEIPAVDGVDLLLDAAHLLGRLVGVVHRQLGEAIEQRADLGDAVLDVALDVLGRV